MVKLREGLCIIGGGEGVLEEDMVFFFLRKRGGHGVIK